jgi:hypothetical protein
MITGPWDPGGNSILWKLPVVSTASTLEMLGIALGQPLGKFRVNADPSRSFSARLSVC